MTRIFSIATALFLAANYARATSDNPIVDLGQVLAANNGLFSTNEWYGIRYSQSPTGDLRFRAPQDIELTNNYSASEPMDATSFGPSCVVGIPWAQGTPDSISDLPQDEDCLLLNVIAPASANASSKLPVMLFIHGGGYAFGNAEIHPGDAMVHQSDGNMIWVAIQYRLNAFGFLAGAEVSENGDRNVGLLDQRAGLNWVQRHIHQFGGDPAKVTINGGSAGGGSVMSQMIMYGGVASPPFRAVMSEYPWWQSFRNQSSNERQYRLLLDTASCSNIDCLRRLPINKLATAVQSTFNTAYENGHYADGDFYFGPSVDGEVIRQLPSQEFKQGHFTRVPLFVNHNALEGYAFSDQNMAGKEAALQDVRTLFPNAKESFISRLFDLYPASDFNSTFHQRARWFGDFIINCPTYYMATAVADYGSPVYKLYFAAGSDLHGAVAPFVKSRNLNGLADNSTLSSIMRDYYVSFAVSLDPNAESYTDIPRPYWPTYMGEQNGDFSVLNVTDSLISVNRDADASPRCDFFHAQSYVVRN
ncbi:Carboxylesterase family [Aspergillus sp. HF37]|nr:Carboxylesterase family [Aspergillus sp. HF37]